MDERHRSLSISSTEESLVMTPPSISSSVSSISDESQQEATPGRRHSFARRSFFGNLTSSIDFAALICILLAICLIVGAIIGIDYGLENNVRIAAEKARIVAEDHSILKQLQTSVVQLGLERDTLRVYQDRLKEQDSEIERYRHQMVAYETELQEHQKSLTNQGYRISQLESRTLNTTKQLDQCRGVLSQHQKHSTAEDRLGEQLHHCQADPIGYEKSLDQFNLRTRQLRQCQLDFNEQVQLSTELRQMLISIQSDIIEDFAPSHQASSSGEEVPQDILEQISQQCSRGGAY